MTQVIAQIAGFLSVAPNQIKRCDEWANVYFVQVHGCRPTFVSKKVIKVESFDEMIARLEREQEDRAAQAESMAARIADALPVNNCADYSKLHSAAVDVIQGDCTFDEAVARFSSKKVIIKKK